MKKIFIAIMAVAAAVSCSQELTVDAPKGAAIGFANAFVENATRAADYTADNIADFSVYGFITKDTEGAIFTDQKVAGSKDAGFTYSPVQYWVGGATYSFSAIVPYEGRHWTYTATNSGNGVISFNNETAVANQDLLFAYATRTTEASITAAPAAVGFTFNHVLSRVKFSFVNGFGEGQNITLKVTNVNITNAYANGTLALENGVLAKAWTPADKDLNVAFGDVAGDKLGVNVEGETTHYYLIPAEDTYEVTFTVAIYQSGVLVDTYDRTATVTVALERGKSYDLQATLTANNTSDDGALYPIEFTVGTVNGWENYTGAEVTVPEHVVNNATELAAAVAEGGNIMLTQDINLDEVMVSRANTYGLFIEKDCVIDGAGYTITTNASRGIAVSGANDVVLKNFNLVASGERGIQVQGGAKKVTIENVTAVAANYTVNLPSSAGATNVTINNCDLKGLNTVNIGAPGAVVNINNTIIRSEDNNETESYSAIDVNKDAVGATVNVNGGEILVTGTHPNTFGARVQATDGAINISTTTKGNTTLANNYYAVVYGDYWYGFETFEDAYAKAQPGETIVLTQNSTIAEGLQVTKSVNFDLNGHTLAYTGNDVVFRVKNGATVTIDGSKANSAIVTNPTNHGGASAGNGYIGLVSEDATLNINGGSYDAQRTCTIAQVVKGTLNVNAGTFKVDLSEYTDANGNASYLLNCTDANYKNGTAVVNVNGGSFYKFNPANNVSEGANTNFAEGKTVTEAEGWYTVE